MINLLIEVYFTAISAGSEPVLIRKAVYNHARSWETWLEMYTT